MIQPNLLTLAMLYHESEWIEYFIYAAKVISSLFGASSAGFFVLEVWHTFRPQEFY